MYRFLWQLCLVGLVLALVSPAGAYLPAPYGGVVTAPLPDMPATLDPTRMARESELQLALLLYDTVYRLDASGRPVPHLVESAPQVSQDGKSWRLRLRSTVMLHNGQPLTAAQVAASLNRLRGSAAGYLLAVVREVIADGNQLVIQLRRPARELPWLLSAPACGVAIPVPRAPAGRSGRAGIQHRGRWIGSGPFRLKVWKPTGVDLVAHRTHFAGRPYLDEIRFKVFERPSAEVASFQVGTLQLSFHGTSVFGSQPRHPFSTVDPPAMTLVYLGVSRARPYMADRRFRLALLMGVDRGRLARLAATGRHEVAVAPVCRRLLIRTRLRAVPFDRGGANRLLGQLASHHGALKRDAASGRLKLSLLVDRSRVEDQIVAGQLVADLDRIGIALTIDRQGAKDFDARLRSGRYDLVLARQPVQVPRGSAALAGVLAAVGQRTAAERCMSSGRCGAAQAARLMKDLPVVPLVHTSARVAHDARLGQLRWVGGGLLGYADVYWMR